MSTDHYAMAQKLLESVGNITSSAEDRRQCLMEAQVHVGLAGLDEQRRIAGVMQAADESSRELADALREMKDESATATRTIPWPPSDVLVEAVASELASRFSELTTNELEKAIPLARSVLDVVGGAGDE